MLSMRYVAPAILLGLAFAFLGWRSTRDFWKQLLHNKPHLRRRLARLPLQLPALGFLLRQIITARILLAMSAL
jgi:type II secretory pathway component PulF